MPSLFHVVRLPVRPSAAPPGILLLHGLGSNESDLFSLAPLLDDRLVVVSARAPFSVGTDAYAWFNVQFTADGLIGDSEQAEASRQALSSFVDELVAEYQIEGGRLFVGGFSQGAIMALTVALTEPEKVAGGIAMSGRTPLELLWRIAPPERLAGLPILVQHGTDDPVLPVENGRGTRDALSRLPVGLTYREYRMGHYVTQESLGDAAAWLSQQIEAGGR